MTKDFSCRLPRAILPVVLSLFLPCLAYPQTPISGVINAYARVIRVDTCPVRLQVGATAGFAPGTAVLIVQMKGAAVRFDESARFGELTALGGAGRYERNRVVEVSGDVLTLERRLVSSYDLAGGVQVISLPEYDDAVVTAPLRAAPWDGAVGGVLALSVRGTLTLRADIDVSGLGFRGGLSEVIEESRCENIFLRNPDDYGVGRTNWRGAPKGEAIAGAGDKPNGRGPLANGGGGGNDHNAGGGGGANAGGGGQGGENRQPGFGCSGIYPGLGGRALPDEAGRLFAGGGGGGGHENNMAGTAGGAGGGIAVILAGAVAVEGGAIRANGATPPANTGDGAGGGGGGGTIVLLCSAVSGDLLVQAGGGAGGTIDNRNQDRCMGPGGGGGGGRILHTAGLTLRTDVAGGAAGRSTNSTACAESTNNATAGAAGRTGALTQLPEGAAAAPPAIAGQPQPIVACAGDSARLSARVEGDALSYFWQVDRGAGFADIGADPAFSGAGTPELRLNAVTAALDGARFRLRVGSACFADVFSQPATLTLTPGPAAAFTFETADALVRFTNRSEAAESYSWDFGDGSTSTEADPSHTYAGAGPYTVTLIATGDCGSDTSRADVTLLLAPVAAFSASATEGCAPLTVRFQDRSSGSPDSRTWLFPGGNPETAGDADVSVEYTQAGSYDVVLIAVNERGRDTLRRPAFVVVGGAPQAGFDAAVDNLSVAFSNTSAYADSYRWDFGDGAGSTEANPNHAFPADGEYLVTLVASGACGSDTSRQTLRVGQPLAAAFSLDRGSGCAPHTVRFTSTATGSPTAYEWRFPGGEPATATGPNPSVTYHRPGDYDVELTVRRGEEQSDITRTAIIRVRDYPEVDFSFEILEQGQVAFTNRSSGAERYTWAFGDGNGSTEASPTHAYARGGVYEVTLNAQNGSCASAANRTVVILLTSTAEPTLPAGLRIFPNPTEGLLRVRSDDPALWPLMGELYTAGGRLLQQQILNGNGAFDLRGQATGIYLLVLRRGKEVWVVRVVKG